MTRVKICGITNSEDALLSAKFGADALGFNFYAKSARYIAPEKAREISERLPPEILKVGVFVNESPDKICEIAETAKLDAIQLHGEETPEFARDIKARTNLKIIKAFRVSPEFKPEDVLQYEVDAILLDAYSPQEHGGTGETFDWKIAKRFEELKENLPRLYVAGGISSDNVGFAINYFHPFAIDVCSGIELEKGKKDKVKLINLIKRAKNREKAENIRLKTQKITDIYELVDTIQLFPAMFLGKYSISLLRAYLDGFQLASEIFEKPFDWKKFYSQNGIDDFQRFLTKYFNEHLGSIGWNNFILKKTEGNEEKALDLFFALLEEFKLEKEDLSNE